MKQPAFDKSLGSWTAWHDETVPMRSGISSCLLGEEVRYDGGHCRNRFVVDILAQWFEWISVCPEMDIGIDAPRPTIRLQADGDTVPLIAPKTGEDFARRMSAYSAKRVRELARSGLDGYILKKGSRSCGTERRAVLETVLDLGNHPTTDQVFDEAAKRIPGISRTTVCRTLDTLTRMGVITKACHPGTAVRYGSRIEINHHLLCQHCDRIIDITDHQLDQIPIPDTSTLGFKITDFKVQLRGICPPLQKKEGKP